MPCQWQPQCQVTRLQTAYANPVPEDTLTILTTKQFYTCLHQRTWSRSSPTRSLHPSFSCPLHLLRLQLTGHCLRRLLGSLLAHLSCPLSWICSHASTHLPPPPVIPDSLTQKVKHDLASAWCWLYISWLCPYLFYLCIYFPSCLHFYIQLWTPARVAIHTLTKGTSQYRCYCSR